MTDEAIETEPAAPAKSAWARLSISVRAIVSGLAVAIVGVQLWALMVVSIGMSWALIPPTLMMLALFLFWTSGRAWPDKTSVARTVVFRPITLTRSQWVWSLAAALLFVICVEAAMATLFRIVPFPEKAFRAAYVVPLASPLLVWAIILCASFVTGICEETGFRGYLQLPIERRHGPLIAIFVSSALFTSFHLDQVLAAPPMALTIFGAGLLLGLLAWASNSLIPAMIGHAAMNLCDFGYWQTGYFGAFTARPISETGADGMFFAALAALIVSLGGFFFMLVRLRTTPQAA